MSFFTRRVGPHAPSGTGTHPRVVDNQPLITCVRHLARRRSAGVADEHLEQDLAAIGTEFDRLLADPVTATAIHDDDRPWPQLAPHLLDLMLAAAGRALATDPSLTGLIADTVLLARRGSRAAWRLRAQAHEQWGDLTAAIAAHEEYLVRTDLDKLGVSTVVTALRGQRDARVALAAALIDADDLGATLPMPGAADLHDLLSRPVRREELEPALEEFLADLGRMPVAELATVREVLQAVGHCLRTSQLRPPPLPADTVRALDLFRIGDLRQWLSGRTICLVADPDPGAAPAGLGARIDGYDLVARFTAGPLDPEHTGSRTDLMVIRHDQQAGWDQPADLRLVLAEDSRDWVQSVRRNLVAGAQRGLADKELRRPARQASIAGPAPAGPAPADPAEPSNAFQLLRLLDHLDVNPAIDLIGFGPGDPFTGSEQDWVRSRAHRVDEHLLSLR